MQKRRHHKWTTCVECGLMIFTVDGLNQHQCTKVLVAKRDAELDMVIHEEMSTWDQEVKKFWKSKDVKFIEWLVKRGRY